MTKGPNELFNILIDLNLKNGETIDLNEITKKITDRLGLQDNEMQVAQYITQVLQSGNYQFNIDDNGNIRANYSRLYILQEMDAEKKGEEVAGILQGFVQKTKTYASELEKQNIKVAEANLRDKFSPIEQDLKCNWITLAIDKVLEMQSQEK